jgi:hypothetical protein
MVILRSKQLAKVQDQLQAANDQQATENRLQLEHSLSAQQERTAKAEAALLQLQEKVRGRGVSPGQIEKLKAFSIGHAKGVVTIQKLDGDPEAVEYARRLFKALEDAGWAPIYIPGKTIGGITIGLSLSIYSEETLPTGDGNGSDAITQSSLVFYGRVLKEALEAAGIAIDHYQVKSGPPIPRNSVFLAIGHKP